MGHQWVGGEHRPGIHQHLNPEPDHNRGTAGALRGSPRSGPKLIIARA